MKRLNVNVQYIIEMSKEFKVHEDFNLEHLSWDEENCHCDPPSNENPIFLYYHTILYINVYQPINLTVNINLFFALQLI